MNQRSSVAKTFGAETRELMQADVDDDLPKVVKSLLLVGKVLINLDAKLSRLESANEKVIEELEQNDEPESSEQFQGVLDEEAELIDGVVSRISELKILKGELERKRAMLETVRSRTSNNTSATEQAAQLSPVSSDLSSIWTPPSTSVQAPIKPPHIEITSFDGDVLKWQEFWDQFEAAIHNARFSSIDKMNYLKSPELPELSTG